MSNSASRLLTLIMLLQRQPNQQAAALATALGVSVRTLHRYIKTLDEMGIPIYSERGPHGGFSLVRGYQMPPLVFTPAEAVAVLLGTRLVRELWGAFYHDAATGAAAKLENLLPDAQREEVAWAQRTLVATNLQRTTADEIAQPLTLLRQATRENRTVQLLYHGREQQHTQRLVDPYAIVQRWGWWYVVGYCHLRRAVRSFRIDRIGAIAATEEHFEQSADFELETYLKLEQASQAQQRVQLHFAPAVAAAVRENRHQWAEMQAHTDGSITVTLFTPDLTWAASLVLAYNGLAVVLEPAALKTLVRERALAIARHYGDSEEQQQTHA